MTTHTTPMEALRRLLDASKQIDFADCKDERVWQALGVGQAVAEGVLRDYVEPEVEQLQARLDAKEARNKMLLSELDALSARYFHDGVPPAHFGKEWFIAVIDDGDKVVLRSLDEENAYDYTTMDATYFKAYRIKKWMQFPDSQYITYVGAAPVAQPAAAPVDMAGLIAWSQREAAAPAIAAPTEVERDAKRWRMHLSLMTKNGHRAKAIGEVIDAVDAAIATGEKHDKPE